MTAGEYQKKIDSYLEKNDMTYAEYLYHKLSSYQHVCVFGVGNMGAGLPAVLAGIGISVDCFCDHDPAKVGRTFGGIQCISVEELERIKDTAMVLIATRFYKEIYDQLKIRGFQHLDRVLDNRLLVEQRLERLGRGRAAEKLKAALAVLTDDRSRYVYTRIVEEWCRNDYSYGQLDDICTVPQYFDRQLVRPLEEEVFVDCGAYDGDTLEEYLQYSDKQFKKVVLFELSRKNHTRLLDHIQGNYKQWAGRLVAENCGVAGFTGTVQYEDDDEGSGIAKQGGSTGRVTALDDYFATEDVTFIKMDIEGAELEALSGARRLIQRCRPRLAVCVYHKPEDLWEIPLYIKEIAPDYHIYIRHHTDLLNETVCYAIPDRMGEDDVKRA